MRNFTQIPVIDKRIRDGAHKAYQAIYSLPIDKTAARAFNAKLFSDYEYRRGDEWQAILNVAYDYWQAQPEGIDFGKSNMIGFAHSVDPLYALAILLGKYNQQVFNGGHIQYFDNGYASIDGKGFMYDHQEIHMHEFMVSEFERLLKPYLNVPAVRNVYRIIHDLELVEIDEYDEEYGKFITCPDCNGEGNVPSYSCDCGDDDYCECESECETCYMENYHNGTYHIENEDYKPFVLDPLPDAMDDRLNKAWPAFEAWFYSHLRAHLHFKFMLVRQYA